MRPPAPEAVRRLYEAITVVANDADDVDAALQGGVDHVCRTMNWPVGHALVVTQAGVEPTRIWHLEDAERFATFREVTESVTFPFADGDGPLRRTARTGEPTWLADIEEEPDFQRARLADDIGVRGALVIPVLVGDATVAVLEFYSPDPVSPDRDVLEVMRHVGVQLGRVFERRWVVDAERRALEAERSYLRMAAHDMRTPLTIASGFLDLLRDEDLSEDERHEAIDAAVGALDNLGRLARNFLVDARLHGGTMRAHSEVCAIRKVLMDALSDVPEVARVAELHCPDDLAAQADPFLLRQALVNLLTNAAKHGQPPITLEAAAATAGVEIAVRDHGPGIDETFVPGLFERFSRASEEREGFGLGLEIVSGLVELQGGTVRYERNEPRGAAFTITLPRPID